MKFGRTASAAEPIGGLLADAVPYFSGSVIVTHVPTATTRYRQRGYDQAALIAKRLAKEKDLPYVPLLARMGQTRQVGSGRSQRLMQLESAFRPVNMHAFKGKEVILIDDIVTTGASIESAARVLRENGAKRVNAAIFAVKT